MVGAILMAVWARLVVAPPMSRGNCFKAQALHFRRRRGTFPQGRGNQAGEADDVHLVLLGGVGMASQETMTPRSTTS